VVFFDVDFVPLVARLAPECPQVRAWVALCDREHLPEIDLAVLCYEDLLAAESADFEWPVLDENTACGLCYTSGTTGNPKGVLYSQRSTVLHAFAVCLPDAMNASAREVVLPVVPMFHVNAWGLPYACALVGAKLVLPGAKRDGASLHTLMEQEGVTMSAGVPTVWMALLQYLHDSGQRFTTLRRVVVGGAACPPALMERFAEYGVEVLHAWGMTELSPLGVLNQMKSKHATLPETARARLRLKQGRPVYGVELSIVDDTGSELPHDGQTSGELLVRGPWIAAGYFGGENGEILRDGWFPTGDVATLDEDGYLQITDRAKDVIKSGGEWISSIELENLAVAHPDVAEAAVIGVPHPRWDERPLLLLVCKEGREVASEAMLDFLRGKVAKWWLPDAVVCVASLPHTATGKLSKLTLRQQFAGYRWPALEQVDPVVTATTG
jgi:fatty-acyl-CoA synthase